MAEKQPSCVKCGFQGNEELNVYNIWYCADIKECMDHPGADKIASEEEHIHKKCNQCGYEFVEKCDDFKKS